MFEQIVASLLDALPLPALLIGPDERLAAINPAAEHLFGAGTVGRHYITVLRQPALLDCVETARRAGRRAEAEYLASAAPRETTWQVTASPVKVAEDGAGILVTFEDRSAMQDAGQIRRDFVANVSHELRTPLTALLGFVETLRGAARDDPEARERFLRIMEREAGRMNRLVDDLLSLSRVESEERMRPTGRVDIAALVKSVVQTLRPVAAEYGTTIAIEGADGPVEIPGDSDQLAQVFTNLIENALKYGGAGSETSITLGQSDHDPSLRGPAVTVTVADTGEGLDPVNIPRLTERFYRVDNHRSREMGGTGLGLAIVKHIVNRHRGRLRIDSTPGQGSRFAVVLPSA